MTVSIRDLLAGVLRLTGWIDCPPAPAQLEDPLSAPHCDPSVLHAHGACRYCDQFPQRQRGRVAQRINFTGQHDPTKAKCPSEHFRPPEVRDAWAGNRPEEYLG